MLRDILDPWSCRYAQSSDGPYNECCFIEHSCFYCERGIDDNGEDYWLCKDNKKPEETIYAEEYGSL